MCEEEITALFLVTQWARVSHQRPFPYYHSLKWQGCLLQWEQFPSLKKPQKAVRTLNASIISIYLRDLMVNWIMLIFPTASSLLVHSQRCWKVRCLIGVGDKELMTVFPSPSSLQSECWARVRSTDWNITENSHWFLSSFHSFSFCLPDSCDHKAYNQIVK